MKPWRSLITTSSKAESGDATATIGDRFVRFAQMYFAPMWLFPRELDG
jgi:hypothetical protein